MPPTYAVFASYAQHDRNQVLEKFFDDFKAALKSAVVHDPQALVFVDRDESNLGTSLAPTIIQAVNRARALICLMSPTYFTREWCGKELEVFLRRQNRLKAGEKQPFIFPVLWVPRQGNKPLPRILDEMHRGDRGFPAEYSRGVLKLSRSRRDYTRFLETLADRVAAAVEYRPSLPPAKGLESLEAIRNALDEEKPFDFQLVTLAADGNSWVPSIDDPAVEEAAGNVAATLDYPIRPLKLNGFAKSLETACATEQIILVVVDAAAAIGEKNRTLDALKLVNFAFLFVDTATPPVELGPWLATLLPDGSFARAKSARRCEVAGSGQLQEKLEVLVDRVRKDVRSATPATKAVDPALAQAASDAGINIESQPNLSGPGGLAS